MTDATLLRRAITASGRSARGFGLAVLGRSDRQVRRWLAGDSPLPADLRGWLTRYVEHPDCPTCGRLRGQPAGTE